MDVATTFYFFISFADNIYHSRRFHYVFGMIGCFRNFLISNQLHINLVTRNLTKKEEDIRNFCSIPRTAQEIMDRLRISNQSKK